MKHSPELILVLNCGSSSIKFALFDAGVEPLPRQAEWSGKVTGIGGPHPAYRDSAGAGEDLALDRQQPYHAALERIREHVVRRLEGRGLRAVAHRVVHGGSKYSAPTRVDAAVLADLKSFIPLAPLHQPFALEAIEVLLTELPELPQVACFDTAFHHTVPQVEQMLALPYAAWQRGLRRYGFHGLSYEYMATVLEERFGAAARGRVIVAHLGSGASLCALQDLRSVATTMGFSALDGLMMGTRCGALDPGAVLYMMEIEKLTLQQVGHVLYHESGLLGVSGVSADPPVLLAQEDRDDATGERVRAALALYVRRIVREIGALTAVLGGLDLLVFTAGVGEHSAELRRRICAGLGFLGPVLDEAANARHGPLISAPESRIQVGVEATNEEWVAARLAAAAVPPA
ncbi:acetate/propionate family kinase [Janthinobacterium fluminis]|uniref:Acetate kinase n=1 Tax=Janthinobacterium fluminis TaxID=2987524 RepID=A0ABT5K1C3_9BURK|nr:acetate/propionate family kinase [Janthinobacterium fluminis]MDC8758669.1 acetate/propionate family kinase [Janthinobacterium fluminis]